MILIKCPTCRTENKYESINKAYNINNNCVVCLEDNKDICVLLCGHINVCIDCASNLSTNDDQTFNRSSLHDGLMMIEPISINPMQLAELEATRILNKYTRDQERKENRDIRRQKRNIQNYNYIKKIAELNNIALQDDEILHYDYEIKKYRAIKKEGNIKGYKK